MPKSLPATNTEIGTFAPPKRRRQSVQIVKDVFRSRSATIGVALLLLYILTATLGPFLVPDDPVKQNLMLRMKPPSFGFGDTGFHPMGTDQLGRDIFSRVVYGSRISLFIGFSVVLVGGIVGCFSGIVAGYYGGWVDRIAMRIVDIYLAFPFILLALIVMAALGTSLRNLIIVLALTGWVNYSRVIRSEALALREREFVIAAEVIGASGWRVLVRHLLPNVYPTLIVLASLDIGAVVITEGSLSFLGLGVPPPTPSWGRMLSEGRDYIATAWWLATFPGLALVFLVLSVNLVGDWLRDELDPRRRKQR